MVVCLNLIEEGEVWMDMIESRNQTSHTYNEKTAKAIVQAVLNNYYQEFLKLQKKLKDLQEKEQK